MARILGLTFLLLAASAWGQHLPGPKHACQIVEDHSWSFPRGASLTEDCEKQLDGGHATATEGLSAFYREAVYSALGWTSAAISRGNSTISRVIAELVEDGDPRVDPPATSQSQVIKDNSGRTWIVVDGVWTGPDGQVCVHRNGTWRCRLGGGQE